MYVNGKKIVGSTMTLGCFNTEKRRPEALALPTSILISIPRKPTNASFSKIIINPEKR
jgi:hypothetical protein